MLYKFLEDKRNLTENAVICGNEKMTYQDLYKKSSILGDKIKEFSSEIVILFIPNGVKYVLAYFSVLYSNKIIYPISSLSKYSEVMSAANLTESKLILCTREYYETIKQVCIDINAQILIVDDENIYINNEQNFNQHYEDSSEKACLLLNTSGSTDKHKIVMLTEKGIAINCKDWVDAALIPEKKANVLLALSVSTSVGNIVMVTCIMLGWTIVFLPTFLSSAAILRTIKKEKITHLISIGSMLNILANDIKNLKYDDEHGSLEFIGVGGNVSTETIKALMNYFKKAGISPGYGMTEATCMMATISPDVSKENKKLFLEKITSSGKPFKHCNIKISSDDNSNDKSGEILISGPTVMEGYYKNTQATNEVIKDGFLHTGDIGYFDDDGFLYVIGRIKNIIKTGGYTVFPEEIETVLEGNEMVKEAYVYGINDPILGEKIESDIILAENSMDVSKIKKYCYENLADYKIPSKINVVTTIEKTKTGKIKRRLN